MRTEERLTGLNGSRPPQSEVSQQGAELRRRVSRGLARADDLVRDLAREQPLLAAGLALTAGFVLGRLVSRHA